MRLSGLSLTEARYNLYGVVAGVVLQCFFLQLVNDIPHRPDEA